jgi:hypothetical protein
MLLQLKNVRHLGGSGGSGLDRGALDRLGKASHQELLNDQAAMEEAMAGLQQRQLERHTTSTSTASIPASAFAVFALGGFPQEDNAEKREFANTLLNRVVSAKESWAKDIENYFVVGHQSPIADVTLTGQGCTEGDTVDAPGSGHTFVKWNCPGFTYLLVTCRVLAFDASGCKYDRAMEYMLYVEPERFADVKWVGIGDDDIGYAQDLLLDYLGHYDAMDRLVLNPAAANLVEQRSGEGPVNFQWNQQARECNNVIPERCVGVIVSRGLFEAAKEEFQMESMESLTEHFGGAHDAVQGLLWWMHEAKWIPMALRYRANEGLVESNLPKVPQLLIAHKLQSAEDYEKFGAIAKGNFPEPEVLSGNKYVDSRNARLGGPASSLTPVTCLPA